jgi:hypothetical protein
MTALELFGYFILGVIIAWLSVEFGKAVQRRDKKRREEEDVP